MVGPVRRRRAVAGRRHPERADAVPAVPAAARRGREGAVTVQLLPSFLAAGAVPAFALGDELEVAPAIYAAGHLPAVAGRDRWWVDEWGCFDGRGSLVTAPLAPQCDCRVDVLDVGGRLFPVNWAGTEPAPSTSGRLWVEGGLYLEPELARDDEHGPDGGSAGVGGAVALCRRRYRVREIRRYERDLQPSAPTLLTALPDPDDASDVHIHVADLTLIDDLAELSDG